MEPASVRAVVGDQGSVRLLHVGEGDSPFGFPKGIRDVPDAARALDQRHGQSNFRSRDQKLMILVEN